MAKKPKKPFSGELLVPFPSLKIGLLMDGETKRLEIERHVKLETEKMDLLLQHYGIDDERSSDHCWYELALRLAKDFCPGFQEPIKKGRKNEWCHALGAMVVVEIDRFKEATGISTDKEAATELAELEPWKSFLKNRKWTANNFSDTGEVLRQKCSTYRDTGIYRLFFDAFKNYELEGRLNEWTDMIHSFMQEPSDMPFIK